MFKKKPYTLHDELINKAVTIGCVNCSDTCKNGREIFDKLSEFYNIGRLKGAIDPVMKVSLHSDIFQALTTVCDL